MSSNREAVQAVVDSLERAGPMDTHDVALGRLALTLADALDAGAGMATAAVSKELRATLAALTAKEVVDDEEDPIFGADLRTEIRYPQEP